MYLFIDDAVKMLAYVSSYLHFCIMYRLKVSLIWGN